MNGVLAYQGSVTLHLAALERLGAPARLVKRPADLEGVDRLILPGGESTVLSHHMEAEGLSEAIRERAQRGDLALFGTCAGAILCSVAPASSFGTQPASSFGTQPADGSDAAGPGRQPVRLGLARTVVRRNAYGRQVDSFRAPVRLEGSIASEPPFDAIFIRAPRFEGPPADAEVLARHDGEPVLVREGRVLLSSFHPELTPDLRVHRYFVEKV